MRHRRSAYELSASQVTTPVDVLALFWRLTSERRSVLSRVLDVGAGDCRFGSLGTFGHYTGVEIDKERARTAIVPKNGELIRGCAFAHRGGGYDACVGNPPYVRHHDIEAPWRERTIKRLEKQMKMPLNRQCNLYLYFLCLGLLKTRPDGLVSMVIPYEWISRPSARWVREFIHANKWSVSVYRFQSEIFPGVLTTASISIIDKAKTDAKWTYHEIAPDFTVRSRPMMTASTKGVLEYARRGKIWGLRGMSPGSQKIFTLSEGERVHIGLSKKDVIPCITRMRHVPRSLKTLSSAAFKRWYIDAGEKCWLIRSYAKKKSRRLQEYLDSVPKAERDNYTCQNQEPWYNFRVHPIPQVLVSSGFTSFGPKVFVNRVGARAIGAVLGIHGTQRLPVRRLQRFLMTRNIERRVVAHASSLKKIEIKQVNGMLNEFTRRGS